MRLFARAMTAETRRGSTDSLSTKRTGTSRNVTQKEQPIQCLEFASPPKITHSHWLFFLGCAPYLGTRPLSAVRPKKVNENTSCSSRSSIAYLPQGGELAVLSCLRCRLPGTATGDVEAYSSCWVRHVIAPATFMFRGP